MPQQPARVSRGASACARSVLSLHLEYLPHHALGPAQVHAPKQDVVVQNVIDVVDNLPLFMTRRQRPFPLVPATSFVFRCGFVECS